MDEITELRRQMAEMKKSLDNYAIVNEQLINTVMKKRSQGLNWFVNGEMIVVPFICMFFFGVCDALNMSVWIPIVFAAACVVSTIIDMKTMRVPKRLINGLNIHELHQFLIRQKRNRMLQLAIELPLSAIGIIWFMFAYFDNDVMFGEIKHSEAFLWIKIITTAVTLIIAVVVIMIIFNKSQRVNDAMIHDLDQLEDNPGIPE